MLTEQEFYQAVERHLDMTYRIALNWFRRPADAADAVHHGSDRWICPRRRGPDSVKRTSLWNNKKKRAAFSVQRCSRALCVLPCQENSNHRTDQDDRRCSDKQPFQCVKRDSENDGFGITMIPPQVRTFQ